MCGSGGAIQAAKRLTGYASIDGTEHTAPKKQGGAIVPVGQQQKQPPFRLFWALMSFEVGRRREVRHQCPTLGSISAGDLTRLAIWLGGEEQRVDSGTTERSDPGCRRRVPKR